jgi:hypothetical protein
MNIVSGLPFSTTNQATIQMIKCSSCNEILDSNQELINAKGETFHPKCFV